MNINFTDDVLMQQLKSGDDAALAVLFARYYQAVCTTALYFVKRTEVAEEIGADVFVKLWNHRDRIELKYSLKAYLMMMTRNESKSYLGQKRQHGPKTEELVADTAMENATEWSSPQSSLELAELNVQINAAIDTLTERTRAIFCMSRFEGMKYREIADTLGISEKAVEHHMIKALSHMRNKLGRSMFFFLMFS